MKNRRFFLLGLILLVGMAVSAPPAISHQRGYLLLVGGKEKPAAALQKFIELCENGPILVIPSASAVPFESGPETAELFRELGATNVDWFFIAGPDTANADSVVQKVAAACGIFFTGGVQSRLMHRLGGTKTANAILDLYFNKGGVIGGTSAGAAVQSEIMLTGDGDFSLLEKDNIVTQAGFGFVKNCIIDQHFVARQRNNRLLSVVIETGKPGIGIDESTAIIYYPDDTFDVYGSGSVVVYDPRPARIMDSTASKKLSVENLLLSVLREQQSFDLKEGKIFKRK